MSFRFKSFETYVAFQKTQVDVHFCIAPHIGGYNVLHGVVQMIDGVMKPAYTLSSFVVHADCGSLVVAAM